MYCLSKREFKKDRLKVLVLGLIIGISIGICAGFLWGTVTVGDMIQTGLTQIPQRMSGIQF
jgi:ABC-type nitrate/sulfonate/bicarbonate transport system permease component